MAKDEFEYRIIHPYEERINPQDDFLDVEVDVDGRTYRGSVTTTGFVERRLKDYEQTGENQGGSYFCAKGMIILRDLEKRTIRRTLKDLVERGDLEEFFEA